ncbi:MULTISPECIES: 1-acyl-sn-glycerol-3-phosphate acyltransferase [unclassified Ruegeria]|uniref:1-acyl-sn-glycerol-3-phosphate acyltransferase n=1 Tax=unclassified Ruegeria TaxID=2625375 RepID=UPI0014879D40|nr:MULTISPECIES: 1-acyl-sn-glycerol-3-phosphate acyltransferase [unclassified Ruegeria]NOD34987.1 glycerol-3-phosphate acyltransferase [Ruegeria sp. HKCCD7296]NOD47933.1 glycerol-3-phosphate acyltransferase [Ruegeria sp. HKCCD5849]NOD52917.1 glycerol-3-phosphate acyltransferase [Ruegeria sp. HKCCD5851]NOD69063.1 glycerol-3-phosphate acyltransferase [Ruegeria sp. HKCCD7303]NOE35231.1 glycerol-3-phosphate acyltransferase [Ruegeria sp. HKCCD7318]
MTQTVELPLWLFLLIVVFAMVTFASHFLFPSVRWFFRRRLERAVSRLNQRLQRPIQPFKLARRHDMIQRLIYDPQVGQAVQQHAQDEGIPEAVAFEKARRYAREIVPSFSAFAYFSFAIRLARLLSNTFYEVRLGYKDEAAIKNIDPDATVVFVMNHRSNMDYVLVTYLAAQQSALSYAVGEWARVWPLSRLIRAMGAYFIRRKSGSELYRQVLSCYVRHATEAGVTQAMFPEGGLSLTGALGRPKLGLLKYIMDGTSPEGRDVVFVPVALNYDRVLEDTILTRAALGSERRFRARIGVISRWILKQIWRRLIGRYKRFGVASVRYGVPISLKEFRVVNDDDVMTDLARELMQRIGQAIPLVPAPAACLLLQQKGSSSEKVVRSQILSMLAEDGHASDQDEAAVENALNQLVERRILSRQGDNLALSGQREDLLEYYAASAPNHRDSENTALAK